MKKMPVARRAVRSATAPRSPEESGAHAQPILFRPAKSQRAFEQITRQIEELITRGHLKPGDKLPNERTLAAQLEVSRNTLREALRSLEIAGILTLRRGASGGAFVACDNPHALNNVLIGRLKVTEFSVADLTQAMRSITLMLFDAAMLRITEQHLQAIEANINAAEQVKDDPGRRSDLLIQFYRHLAEASQNQILVVVADVFVDLLRGWVLRLGSLGGDRVIRSRRTLLRYLRTGDKEAALSELERYLDELHALWLRGGGP